MVVDDAALHVQLIITPTGKQAPQHIAGAALSEKVERANPCKDIIHVYNS